MSGGAGGRNQKVLYANFIKLPLFINAYPSKGTEDSKYLKLCLINKQKTLSFQPDDYQPSFEVCAVGYEEFSEQILFSERFLCLKAAHTATLYVPSC